MLLEAQTTLKSQSLYPALGGLGLGTVERELYRGVASL